MSRQDAVIGSTPFVHAEIVPGDSLKVILYLKGGGSENMTGLRLFKPTASVDEIIGYIIEWIVAAGPNPCPPLFLGVGIGGTADIAMLNSKKALFRGPGTRHANPFYDGMEARILERANRTGLGPLGFGGVSTVAVIASSVGLCASTTTASAIGVRTRPFPRRYCPKSPVVSVT